MLPSCKEVAQLASDNLDTPLKGNRWLKMKLHLLMCTYCRRYNKQMGITQKTVCDLESHNRENSADSKDKIFEKVEADYNSIHSDK